MSLVSEAAVLAGRIDALLPQTQCTRCGYPACRPYAEAVAASTAPINRCPPGGDPTITALAALLGVPALPLDASCGPSQPLQVARIDEAACIGCTLCIRACPVDAIVGAAKLSHTVLARHCTGCGLCLPPCPVDCIAMESAGRAWTRADADAARRRVEARNARLATRPLPRTPGLGAVPALRDATREERRRTVAAALARARARRAGEPGAGA